MAEQLKEVIENLGTAFEEFKIANTTSLGSLQTRLERIELASTRPAAGGAFTEGGPEHAGGEVLRDAKSGKLLRVFRKDAKLAAAVPQDRMLEGEAEADVGEFIAALATGDWRHRPAELKTFQGIGVSDPAGGYMIPEGLSARIFDLARARSVLVAAGLGTVPMETSSLDFVTITSDPLISTHQEGVDDLQSSMTFGRVRLTARTVGAIITLSNELLADSPNAASIVQDTLRSRPAITYASRHNLCYKVSLS